MNVVLQKTAIATIADYLESGGGSGIRTARRFGPDATIEELTAAGLRGRGGGGFPTGAKWASIRRSGGGRHFVVVNGAEGEPATFKDRSIMMADPYRVIEGAAIAAFAIGSEQVFIAVKKSFALVVERLRSALAEMEQTGLLEGLGVEIVEGPDEYLFGEEKALLEVIEGREPLPRQLPPWQHGLFATVPMGWESATPPGMDPPMSNPTLVNNVETLVASAHILDKGASWFRSMGTVDSPGTITVTIVGDVVHPGVHEVEMGTPLSAVLEACGGPLPNREFKAALSGVSNAVLCSEDFDVPLTYEDLRDRGSGLGAAGFVIYDDSRDMVSVAREVSRFLAVESCGQCPPCKQGSIGITEQLVKIESGQGEDEDLGQINSLLRSVTDANRCYLGTEEQIVISSILRRFPEDFVAHLDGNAPPVESVLIPLIKDIAPDGTVTYDERHALKRTDWTFED
ncbi:MAG TPA: NADH-ubiquinone oxidoreductase-F iron-sulfur binding region domain-containing protein [Microthrixaceae bacterium]|nr:NADH-ubiquinone oxidoreductase-F iron-sulfur binding region domain-containing protein [Microthrixaceae bacterium]